MLFALERDRASGEQQADEHHRDGDGDHDGERVERRTAAMEELGVNGDRLADRLQDCLREGEVLGGEGREGERPFQRLTVGTRGLAGDHAAQQRRDFTEPDEVRGRAEHAEIAALQQQADRLRGGALDLFGEAKVRLREGRVERGLHERLLERIAVVEHFEVGLGDVGGEPRGDVVGDHDGGEHIARLDLRDGLRARGGGHGFDLIEELRGILADVNAAAADLDASRRGWFR